MGNHRRSSVSIVPTAEPRPDQRLKTNINHIINRTNKSRMAPAGARRRAPEKNPGTRRRTDARTVQERAGVENSSGQSDSRKRKWLCDYTNQPRYGRPSTRTTQYADRGYRGSRPPQPRDQSLRSTNKRRFYFSTQYAVRSRYKIVVLC